MQQSITSQTNRQSKHHTVLLSLFCSVACMSSFFIFLKWWNCLLFRLCWTPSAHNLPVQSGSSASDEDESRDERLNKLSDEVSGVCCVAVFQRKTKDRADGMREKSAHFPRRDSNLYLSVVWDTCHRVSDYTTRVRPPRVSRNNTHPSAPPRNNHAWNTPTPICGTATSSICKNLRWVGQSVCHCRPRTL